MSILFYDHLIHNKHELIEIIEISEAPDNHKGKAKQLLDDTIHHAVIHFCLSALPEHKHSVFLETVHERPYDPELLMFLKEHAGEDFEVALQKEISSLVAELRDSLTQK